MASVQNKNKQGILKELKQLAHAFPEIESMYHRRNGETLEVFVLGDLTRDREDAYYEREAELNASLPVGSFLPILFNRRNFEASAELTPPEDAEPLRLRSE